MALYHEWALWEGLGGGFEEFYSETPDANIPKEDVPTPSSDDTLKEWGMTVR